MSNYRDHLCAMYSQEIGSIVGCGLDRLGRECSSGEVQRAVAYYNENKAELDRLPIGARRDAVARHIDPSHK